jgi:hypothetical protein
MPERLRENPLVIFFVLAIAIAALRWPFAWTGNEEDYFLIAHRLVEPSAYGPFDAAFDSSRGKWLGLLTFGWTIKLFGFEAAHKLLGALTIAVTAIGLVAVARMLRLGVLAALSVLLLFVILRQSIVGGEWFIGGIETKAFAYGFGLLALPAAYGGRTRVAALLVALSAYFHFLVGGFWFLTVALFQAFDPNRRAALRSFVGLTIVLLLPLLAGLLLDVRAAAGLRPPAGMPDSDNIYSIIRASYHVAPFAGPHPWWRKGLAAALLALMLAPLAWLVARRTTGALPPLLRTLSVTLLLLPFALLASWFDRHHGALGKFYLFRPASPLLLLILFASAALIQNWLKNSRWAPLPWVVVTAGSVAYILVTPHLLVRPHAGNAGPLIAAIRANTAPGQVVLEDPLLDQLGGPILQRRLGRPMFVSWKFVPTNPADIYKWYERIELRQRLFDNGCPADKRIGALILDPADLPRKAACGRLIYQDKEAAVLAMRS